MKNPNNTINSIKTQTDLFSPMIFVVRQFLSFNARKLTVVAILSFLGSMFTAGGYLLLVPLTKYVTGNADAISVKGFKLESTPFFIGLVLFSIVALVFAGIQMNYRYYLKTLDVMRSTTIESSVRGLQVCSQKFFQET